MDSWGDDANWADNTSPAQPRKASVSSPSPATASYMPPPPAPVPPAPLPNHLDSGPPAGWEEDDVDLDIDAFVASVRSTRISDAPAPVTSAVPPAPSYSSGLLGELRFSVVRVG